MLDQKDWFDSCPWTSIRYPSGLLSGRIQIGLFTRTEILFNEFS